jgi:hypothetical protein
MVQIFRLLARALIVFFERNPDALGETIEKQEDRNLLSNSIGKIYTFVRVKCPGIKT